MSGTVSSYYTNAIESNNSLIEEKREQISEWEELLAQKKKAQKNIWLRMSELKREWGVKFFSQMTGDQKSIFGGLRSDFYATKFTSTALSNKIFSANLSVFDLAIDNSYLNNELSLAKHLEA